MKHEIDDTDIKILETVISFDINPQEDGAIEGKMGGSIEIGEVKDRIDILASDHNFVKIIPVQGTGSGGRRTIQSTPQGRQFLRDRDAKQKKETDN